MKKIQTKFYNKKARRESRVSKHLKSVYGLGKRMSGSFGSKNR